MSTAAPPLEAPASNERKYDRQLRLWGASGQAALENAHVLLIGATVVGTEALKNLVLPGIGAFTVYDPQYVDRKDVAVNFFFGDENLHKPRAEELCRAMQELNPDVKGHWTTKLANNFDHPLDLTPYTLVIFTFTSERNPSLERVARACRDAQIPLFYTRSISFFGSFSVQLPPCFPIVDTHPDPDTISDLRLLKPWPALVEYASRKSRDLEKMDDHEHGHVPFVVLLLHYLEVWKESHEGRVPSNYKEKNEFRALVREGMRTKNAEGGEENFEEAIGAVLKNLNHPDPNPAVTVLFEAPEAKALAPTSTNFWVMVKALSSFVETHGVLPLSGTVPDMKAQSADYMELQAVYKSKAKEDAADMLRRVRELESTLRPALEVAEQEVEAFCKGAGHIKLIRGRPLFTENGNAQDWSDSEKKNIVNTLDDDTSLALLYLVILSYDIPFTPAGMAPDELDLQHVYQGAYNLVNGLAMVSETVSGTRVDDDRFSLWMRKTKDMQREIMRARSGEIHTTSAFVGGLVAQDAIKVITKQYVPVDNTCVYDGIKSITAVLRM